MRSKTPYRYENMVSRYDLDEAVKRADEAYARGVGDGREVAAEAVKVLFADALDRQVEASSFLLAVFVRAAIAAARSGATTTSKVVEEPSVSDMRSEVQLRIEFAMAEARLHDMDEEVIEEAVEGVAAQVSHAVREEHPSSPPSPHTGTDNAN